VISSIVTNNKSVNNYNNIHFKNKTKTQEKRFSNDDFLKNSYKSQEKIEIISPVIGLAVGIICKLTNKKNPINKGIYAYFASLISLFTILGIKEIIQKKDLHKKENNL